MLGPLRRFGFILAVPGGNLSFHCRCGGRSVPEQTPARPHDVSRSRLLPRHHQRPAADAEGLSVHQEPHCKFLINVSVKKGEDFGYLAKAFCEFPCLTLDTFLVFEMLGVCFWHRVVLEVAKEGVEQHKESVVYLQYP